MDPKLIAFLSLIGWSEGTSTSPITKNNGYDVIVTGVNGPSVFTDYSKHPFEDGGYIVVRDSSPALYSTAAGRYQLLARYWKAYKTQLGLTDYSPTSQDAVAVQQMKERGAVDLVASGKIPQAIAACSNIWASFPGNDYAQGGRSLSSLIAQYAVLEDSGR